MRCSSWHAIPSARSRRRTFPSGSACRRITWRRCCARPHALALLLQRAGRVVAANSPAMLIASRFTTSFSFSKKSRFKINRAKIRQRLLLQKLHMCWLRLIASNWSAPARTSTRQLPTARARSRLRCSVKPAPESRRGAAAQLPSGRRRRACASPRPCRRCARPRS